MLFILLFFTIDIVTAQDNFNIFIPDYIQPNTNFEVSIISSNKFQEADRLDIYISPDISLTIIKVILLVGDQKLPIQFYPEYIEEYSAQFKKISINLTDSSLFSSGAIFQLIIKLRSTQSAANNIKFFGQFLSGEQPVGYLVNSELELLSGTDHLYNLFFNYYQKFSAAGKAVSFSQGSYLNIPFVYTFDKVLAAEFWIKIENPCSSFLKVINWETNQIEYYLSINDNQLLIFNSMTDELLPVKSFFISKNVWYHFNINFDKEKSEISFYCNDMELALTKVLNNMDFENLVLHFQNKKQDGIFNLDQVRIINLEDSFLAIKQNKNYLEYSDDSSNVLLQLNFDDEELNTHLDSKMISFENINLVKSDAPIFPRSPEISVRFSDNYYEINWAGGSYKDAAEYALERSIGKEDFVELKTVNAENDDDKEYSIVTEKVEIPEIVYFRIKQINKDGSIIYSDVAKVGQGIVEDAIIKQNFPNPFNPTTLIEFELIQDSDVEVKVFDLAGKEISLLHKGFLNKGVHQFTFDGSGFPSGVYLYQVITPLTSQTRKMILAK